MEVLAQTSQGEVWHPVNGCHGDQTWKRKTDATLDMLRHLTRNTTVLKKENPASSWESANFQRSRPFGWRGLGAGLLQELDKCGCFSAFAAYVILMYEYESLSRLSTPHNRNRIWFDQQKVWSIRHSSSWMKTIRACLPTIAQWIVTWNGDFGTEAVWTKVSNCLISTTVIEECMSL